MVILLGVITYIVHKGSVQTASWQDAVALMQQHPNPTKPWNPAAVQETVTPGQQTTPPANTSAQNSVISPVPAPPSTVTDVQLGHEFKLKPGQTALQGNLTLESLHGTTAKVTFGCTKVKPSEYTISVGGGLSLKPDCTTAVDFIRVENGQAVFIVHAVK